MPYKDLLKRAEYNKAYLKNHYQENKQYYLDKNKRRQKELAVIINEIKNKPCMDCGKPYPFYVMDFDHRDGRLKEESISKMIMLGISIEKIKEEIKKCDLVCSNCHRIRTYKRKNNASLV